MAQRGGGPVTEHINPQEVACCCCATRALSTHAVGSECLILHFITLHRGPMPASYLSPPTGRSAPGPGFSGPFPKLIFFFSFLFDANSLIPVISFFESQLSSIVSLVSFHCVFFSGHARKKSGSPFKCLRKVKAFSLGSRPIWYGVGGGWCGGTTCDSVLLLSAILSLLLSSSPTALHSALMFV